MKKAAVFGSFDPLTLGHLDIIERSAKIFDEVHVFVGVNSAKTSMFSLDLRLKWLNESLKDYKNVICHTHSGLSIDACRQYNCSIMVRGIRNGNDFDYEANIAFVNRTIDASVETFCLFANPALAFCSSSNVRELIKYDQDISKFVPQCVISDLSEVKK